MLEDPNTSQGDVEEEEDIVSPKILLEEESFQLGGFELYFFWVGEYLGNFRQDCELLCTQFLAFLHQRILKIDLLKYSLVPFGLFRVPYSLIEASAFLA